MSRFGRRRLMLVGIAATAAFALGGCSTVYYGYHTSGGWKATPDGTTTNAQRAKDGGANALLMLVGQSGPPSYNLNVAAIKAAALPVFVRLIPSQRPPPTDPSAPEWQPWRDFVKDALLHLRCGASYNPSNLSACQTSQGVQIIGVQIANEPNFIPKPGSPYVPPDVYAEFFSRTAAFIRGDADLAAVGSGAPTPAPSSLGSMVITAGLAPIHDRTLDGEAQCEQPPPGMPDPDPNYTCPRDYINQVLDAINDHQETGDWGGTNIEPSGVATHLYPGGDADSQNASLAEGRMLFEYEEFMSVVGDLPVWVSEIGAYSSRSVAPPDSGTLYEHQREVLVNTFLDLQDENNPPVGIFGFKLNDNTGDDPAWGVSSPTNVPKPNLQTAVPPAANSKPSQGAYCTFAAMAGVPVLPSGCSP